MKEEIYITGTHLSSEKLPGTTLGVPKRLNRREGNCQRTRTEERRRCSQFFERSFCWFPEESKEREKETQ
jgi:hypothetical protein